VEISAFDVDACHFGFRDDDAFGITVVIEFAVDLQAGFCGCGGDQINDHAMADQGFRAPVLGDEREQTVLDLVPLCAAETYEERSNAQNHMEAD
jgi:hypothetical protein